MIINDVRALAYTAKIDDITPIPNYDRVELAHIGGWTVIVSKNDNFKSGDMCVYFEIDSKVPEDDERFAFLAKRNYKVKTLKMCGVYSQGLIMPLSAFSELSPNLPEHTDLTKKLGITYNDPVDNVRKANASDPKVKYRAMASRHANLFKKPFVRWLMRREWGRKLMFVFFGKKRDKPNSWPKHICAKTDVERIQNMTWILKDKSPFVASEKVDGSSVTFAAERTKFGKIKYYVCSRNVVFLDESQKCYYDDNIYFEAYKKYNIKDILTQILNDYNLPNVAIQAEVFGEGIQKRNYSFDHHEIRVFHIVSQGIKLSMDEVVEICNHYGLPHVHIFDDNYILPDTIEELQEYVESHKSAIDGGLMEGIVFYDKQTGQTYFKFVSPAFLMKYHS